MTLQLYNAQRRVNNVSFEINIWLARRVCCQHSQAWAMTWCDLLDSIRFIVSCLRSLSTRAPCSRCTLSTHRPKYPDKTLPVMPMMTRFIKPRFRISSLACWSHASRHIADDRRICFAIALPALAAIILSPDTFSRHLARAPYAPRCFILATIRSISDLCDRSALSSSMFSCHLSRIINMYLLVILATTRCISALFLISSTVC
mmetsp:Transcript_51611/g.75478  ORF Transcript_51611/g.75478 Transcript_51611/m.75478 type:complete len:203 (-) Transcript_51611:2212-2820(-)